MYFRSVRLLRTFLRPAPPSRLYTTAPSSVGFNNYDQEKANFRLDVPKYYNFSEDVIGRWANIEKTVKSSPAFWWVDDNNNQLLWSFSQLHEYSKRTANILTGPCRLQPNDRVMVILPRIPQWWLLNLAAMRTATILIPGTTQLTERDILKRITLSNTKCIVADPATAEKIDSVIKECPSIVSKLLVTEDLNLKRSGWINFTEAYNIVTPEHECVRTKQDDPMTIFFTSGTTGDPKMTEHTHASYGLACLITGKFWLDLSPNDIHWNLSDTGWAKSAWSNLFAPWMQGSCVFIHHTTGFNPQRVLELFERYPLTTFCSAPTAYRMMVLQNLTAYNFPKLRHCVSAGEPLNPEVTDSWLGGTGQTIREGYGQTETVLQCGSFRCIPNKPGSMGKPAPGMDVHIIDHDGSEMGEGKEGDIAIRVSPERPVGLFSRYVDEPERTASTYRGDYYVTGDRAYRDADGYLWFVGRADDVILSAGYRIGPFEVESALIEHPAVAESAVVSSPDPLRGEVVKAFVMLTPKFKDADRESLVTELQEHVKNVTAPYKYPRKIEFVESLPKTVSLKIRRIELRNKEWGRE